MTETKIIEREYVIPLRRAFIKVAKYRRAGRAVKAIKIFVAKHMKVQDRDTSKIKLDKYLNNEIWFRGVKNPPSKVKVKVIKNEENIFVTFNEVPKHIEFLKQKHERYNKKSEDVEKKKEEIVEKEKTQEDKKEEAEKEKSVAIQHEKEASQEAKIQKHLTKIKEPKINRMALKK